MSSMKHKKSFAAFALLATAFAGAGLTCPGSGVGLLPFGSITAVQLFDQPNFTVAFSVDTAVTNPAAVAKVNWVFGDGGGFVEGAADRTSITYRYLSTGNFEVTAFVFDSLGLAEQINGFVSVVDNGIPPPGPQPTDLPGLISGGNPTNGAQNVSAGVILTWTGAPLADSHDVYLGTDQLAIDLANDADAANFKGNQTATSFDPGGLLPGTTYFWRIDGVNAVGITKGSVRSFTTAVAPAKAKSPIPQNGSMNARVDQVLQWTAGTGATSRDVYFGDNLTAVTNATPDTADIFKGNQTATSFDPEDENATVEGELLGSTTYFWRIDEVGPGGTTMGDIWTFTTRAPPPMIGNPNPPDTEVDVDIDTVLTWTAPASVESFDVYLGVDPVDVTLADRNSPEFLGNQTAKNFAPATLLADTDYFWRIDTRGPGGTTMGFVLTFKTADVPAQAILTSPAHQAQNQDVQVPLEWMAGAGGGPLTGYEIFLSTSQSQVLSRSSAARVATLGASETMFTPSSPLASNTEHFWTVDAMGPGGRREGPIFRFRTGTLPGLASMPMPPNGGIGVEPDVVLQWTAGANALSHNVYFGTNQTAVTNADEDNAEFRGNQLLGSEMFSPPAGTPTALAANTQFFWRIDEVGTGGVRKGTTWNFRTGPGKAINPDPPNNSNNRAVTINLSWTAGAGAASHDVYLGTDLAVVTNATPLTTGVFRGNQTATTFDPPGNLSANTTHFWRIDSVASDGTKTTGDVWTFTTELGKATNPIPANMATGVALDVLLEWNAGAGANMHDVYFGTSLSAVSNATTADPEFRGQQADTLFDPTSVLAINPNTQYFWRIDSVATGGAPVRKGDIWRYTTLGPPAQVSGPNPVNGATGVSTTTSLTWAAADGAETYDVYFGTNLANVTNATTADAEFQGNQSNRVFTPGVLLNNTQYFWRIDSKNAAGTTTGTVFSFTTVP